MSQGLVGLGLEVLELPDEHKRVERAEGGELVGGTPPGFRARPDRELDHLGRGLDAGERRRKVRRIGVRGEREFAHVWEATDKGVDARRNLGKADDRLVTFGKTRSELVRLRSSIALYLLRKSSASLGKFGSWTSAPRRTGS